MANANDQSKRLKREKHYSKNARRLETEYRLSEMPHPKRMCDVPRENRGPSNNKHGGHKNSRFRGYWTKGIERFGACRTFTDEEKAAVAKQLKKDGLID